MSVATERRISRGGRPSVTPPPSGTVDLWRFPLELPSSRLAELRASLTGDEVARAARFRRAADADRFVAARGQARRILGGYLGRPPSEVGFAYGPFGKPSLLDCHALEFNLAHSEGLALLAVTAGAPVGVDVEVSRPRFGGPDIARQFFAAGEIRQLAALPEADREAGFLRCWTRKEAYVKARGAGLQIDLGSFEVSLSGARARLLRCPPGDEPERWSLIDLSDPAAGYVAALAVEEPRPRLRRRRWKESDGGA